MWFEGIAFHPVDTTLATIGQGNSIRLWSLDAHKLLESTSDSTVQRYATAKIVLVGDSGVGKTTLAWRIVHGSFVPQLSTHGQQSWVIASLNDSSIDGTTFEAVLWDLAGQVDYRIVHTLFLDDADLAILVFDQTRRFEMLSGIEHWLAQLRQSHPDLRTILVGARGDLGSSTLTVSELSTYCDSARIAGGYVSTSAKSGSGISLLLSRIKSQLNWTCVLSASLHELS